MDVEKMYNDWCEQAKKERENIENNILLGHFLFKDVSMSEPIINQQDNDEYSINLVVDYEVEDEFNELMDNLKNYGKITETT
jgi:hypothetical protein